MKQKFLRSGDPKSGFIKIMSGTVVAQLITLAIMPLLTRLYSVEDFGALTFVTSISLLVGAFASMRLETAMMLPKKNDEVSALLLISVLSATIISVIAGLLTGLMIKRQHDLATTPLMPLWVTLTIMLTALFTVLNHLALRKSGYGQVGKRTVAQAIGTNGGQISLYAYPGGGLGLIGGNLIGRSIGIISLVRFCREFFTRPDFPLAGRMLKKYWKFPAVFAPSSAFNAFGVQFPVLFVASWFGVGLAGILGLAERIVGIPMTLIGNAVGQVLDAEIAKGMRAGKQDFIRLYLSISGALGGLALIVGSLFFFLGEWAVPLFLGSEWELAGTCVKIMSISVALRLIASPTARVITLFQKSGGMILIDVTRTLFILGVVLLITKTGSQFLQAVLFFNLALALIYLITWLYGLKIVFESARSKI